MSRVGDEEIDNFTTSSNANPRNLPNPINAGDVVMEIQFKRVVVRKRLMKIPSQVLNPVRIRTFLILSQVKDKRH